MNLTVLRFPAGMFLADTLSGRLLLWPFYVPLKGQGGVGKVTSSVRVEKRRHEGKVV